MSQDRSVKEHMQTSSYNPPITLPGEGKWLLTATNFETTNSVFIITDANITFSITTPNCLFPWGAEETIKKPNELLELRS